MDGTRASLLQGPEIGLGSSALHVLSLSGAAVALPLYDVLSDGAHFFAARNARPSDVVTLVVLLSLALPAALIVAEGLAQTQSGRLRRCVHQFWMALLAGLWLLRLVNSVGEPPAGLVLAAVAAATAGALLLYARFDGVRRLLSVLAPATLVLPVYFLLGTPVREIAFPEPMDEFPQLEIERPVPIVMVIFDELPTISLLDGRGGIDGRRFPNFARLAATANFYRYANTTGDTTPRAVASILTGRLPGRKKLPGSYQHHPQNLFALLGNTYELNTWESSTAFLPESLRGEDLTPPFTARMVPMLQDVAIVYQHVVTPAAWRHRLPDISQTWGGFGRKAPSDRQDHRWGSRGWIDRLRGRGRGRIFEAFIDSVDRAGGTRPVLHFHHSMLPHAPFNHLPSGKLHSTLQPAGHPKHDPGAKQAPVHPVPVMRRSQQKHFLQTAYADLLLGRLLDRLEALELFDPALVIVMADHGRAFVRGEFPRDPNEATYPEILFVPLFLKLPGQRKGVTSPANASLTDVVPTVADVLGFELPWPVDGSSLLSDREDPDEVYLVSTNVDRIFQLPYRAAAARHDELERRNAERFDLDDPEHDLYRFGPYRHLIGRAVAEIPGLVGPLAASTDRKDELTRVRPEAQSLPAVLTGRLLRAQASALGKPVAVSINGVVQAVVEIYEEEGELHFDVQLPEESLQPGRNHLAVYAIPLPHLRAR